VKNNKNIDSHLFRVNIRAFSGDFLVFLGENRFFELFSPMWALDDLPIAGIIIICPRGPALYNQPFAGCYPAVNDFAGQHPAAAVPLAV